MYLILIQVAALLSVILSFACLFLFARYFRLWVQSVTAGAGISLLDFIAMSWRRVDAKTVLRARIAAQQMGLPITTAQLEAHYLAGGDLPRLMHALAVAKQDGLPVKFERLAAIDLAGGDIEAAAGEDDEV